MLFIAQANAIPQTENIAIQILIWVILVGGGTLITALKISSSWIIKVVDSMTAGQKENSVGLTEIKRTIIEENAKVREQYLAENARKREIQEIQTRVLISMCGKMEAYDEQRTLIGAENEVPK